MSIWLICVKDSNVTDTEWLPQLLLGNRIMLKSLVLVLSNLNSNPVTSERVSISVNFWVTLQSHELDEVVSGQQYINLIDNWSSLDIILHFVSEACLKVKVILCGYWLPCQSSKSSVMTPRYFWHIFRGEFLLQHGPQHFLREIMKFLLWR